MKLQSFLNLRVKTPHSKLVGVILFFIFFITFLQIYKKWFSPNSAVKFIGSELYIPTEVYATKNNSINQLTIVSFIDGNCSDCIDYLEGWKNYISEMKEFKNLNYIFFTNAIDYSGFTRYIKKEIKFSLPVFYDDGDSFFEKNNLSSNKILQTFLIDANNTIILVGNPLLSERLNVSIRAHPYCNNHHHRLSFGQKQK